MPCGASSCGLTTATILVAHSNFLQTHSFRGHSSYHLLPVSRQIFSVMGFLCVPSPPKAPFEWKGDICLTLWPIGVSMLHNLGPEMVYSYPSGAYVLGVIWYEPNSDVHMMGWLITEPSTSVQYSRSSRSWKAPYLHHLCRTPTLPVSPSRGSRSAWA